MQLLGPSVLRGFLSTKEKWKQQIYAMRWLWQPGSRSQTAGSTCGSNQTSSPGSTHWRRTSCTGMSPWDTPFCHFSAFLRIPMLTSAAGTAAAQMFYFTSSALLLRITSFLLSKQTKQRPEPLRFGTDSKNRNNSSIQPRNSLAQIMAVIYCYHLIYFLSLEDEFFMLIVKHTWQWLSQWPLWPCVL